uniref:SFRICE_003826 n=1 Tax=Spodoptera frugiperda TaxID=7108 RepID=A0A2H1W0X8_SPOFR
MKSVKKQVPCSVYIGSNSSIVLLLLVLVAGSSSAPAMRLLSTMVTGVTTGLEIPTEATAGTGVGTGSVQLVINVHTDSNGNIEVFTN